MTPEQELMNGTQKEENSPRVAIEASNSWYEMRFGKYFICQTLCMLNYIFVLTAYLSLKCLNYSMQKERFH